MRNCIGSVKFVWLLGICILLLISGCVTPKHSNTLIFGTNTKFALDVSADPTGMPSVTVGYKRQEAVWMPLLANKDKEGTPAAECVTGNSDNCLFMGNMGNDKDTYSVLASFGAKFSGGAQTKTDTEAPKAEAKASGGLAQYFATGLAARILAKEGGANLVSVQPVNEKIEKIPEPAPEDISKLRKPLRLAYIQMFADKQILFDEAAQTQGFSDFRSFLQDTPEHPTLEQVRNVRVKLEEDQAIKAKLEEIDSTL